ncbi:MAG: recombinase RecA [Clostridia bacterium]|nr:recombinase RecA [Clostridia bacterium]
MKQVKKKAAVETAGGGEEKKKALAAAITQIEKDFGKGTIMRLGENARMNVEAVPTGSLTLDLALGIGGVPRGRIVEIFGPESSGKTTVALHIVAEVQKRGGTAAFIDAEHALDPVYAKALGVDIDELLVSQPDSGEQALDVTEHLVRSGAVDVVVVDSVAALVPQQEIDGTMGASHVGLHARLMSQALRKLSGIIAKTNCVAIFINQLREKVGVMYGNPETTTGGRALKFYASVRLDVRKTESLKQGGDVYGNKVKVKVVKNKVAPPFKVAEFEIIYGKGISKAGEILEIATNLGIIKKSGSFFYYNDEKLAQGKDAARLALEKNTALADEIEEKIKARAAETDIVPEETYSLDDDDDPTGEIGGDGIGEEGFDLRVLGVDADE